MPKRYILLSSYVFASATYNRQTAFPDSPEVFMRNLKVCIFHTPGLMQPAMAVAATADAGKAARDVQKEQCKGKTI